MDLRDQLQSALGSAYTIDRELPAGGMSRVFVATENRLNRSVVVKVLQPELAQGVSAARFEREIQVVAQLQQANIVPLLAAGEMSGLPYFTMPFVAGESLRAHLAKGPPPSVAESVSVLRDVARALSYAHERGVVHRDIKPENVLLSHGTAVVSDFGIAKALSASRTQSEGAGVTQTGTSVGTPAYMSPEQAAGDPNVDARSDIYSFGCVAYELLAGRPPFVAPTPQRVIAAHISEKPQNIAALNPNVPPALAALVMRCLEKQPESRPATAGEISGALDAVTTPSGAMAAGQPGAKSRFTPRRRRLLAIAIVFLTVFVFGRRAMNHRAASADTSIAVLPFTNLSGDKSNDYFGEGLAEEMTAALSKAGLRVIGRGSARTLVARGLDAQQIAKELGVASVLQGTVQRADSQVRITVSLTSSKDGAILWSDKYDRKIKDVFAVQDEIARSVASEMQVTMTGAPRTLVRNETSDPEAHALYLQGLYLWNRRTATTLRAAIKLFEQAVARDPTYARAQGGIALAYVVLSVYDQVPADSIFALSRAAAGRALAVDSTLPEAYTALGYADACEWKNGLAEQEFQRAIAADPTYATGHFWHSLLLQHVGRFDEAMKELTLARSLEPASLIINVNAALQFAVVRQYRQSDSVTMHVLGLDPAFALAFYWLANSLVAQKMYDSSYVVYAKLQQSAALRPSEIAGVIAYAYASGGRTKDARAILARAAAANGGTMPVGGSIAAALYALGDKPAGVAMLRRAVDEHDVFLLLMGRAAKMDGLRAEPATRELFARMETP